MHPAHRLVQLGLKSLGFDPGEIDSWWGPNTHRAAQALISEGPAKSSLWAVKTLQRGLADLGYYEGNPDGLYGSLTRKALKRVVDAGGEHAASHATSEVPLLPVKPSLKPVKHGTMLYQGYAGTIIETYCLHCAAVPGTWAVGKSNREILADVRRWHTAPKAEGGRGWSDIGYHAITCPDGEVLEGRPVGLYGAGAIGYNKGVFHHLMIEVRTITALRLPEDYFTPDTLDATKLHLEKISDRTPIKRLMGHREVANKLCPGFEVIDREWTERAVR